MEKTYYFSNPNMINKDTKLIVGIGDSFCAGRGSCSLELWEKYGWDMNRMYTEGATEVNKSNYENSFINQLCKYYLTDWTPLNLGMSGKGTRFSVNELFINPTLGIENAKEIIVVFVVSGFERFDIANNFVNQEHFVTQWPVYDESTNGRVGYSALTKDADCKSIYDETFVLCEFLLNVIHLTNWCKLHNAKLLLISAFNTELNLKHFRDVLGEHAVDSFKEKTLTGLLNYVPWSRIIRPMGYSCITDMLMHLEGWDEFMPNYGFRNMHFETVGPNGYMSKCQHPTEKGHRVLAEIVYEHILKYNKLVNNLI